MSNFNWKYLFNPKKWLIFVRSMIVTKFTGVRIAEKDIISFAEQIVYRTVKCRVCLDNGRCTDCGCKMPEAITDPGNWCSDYQWEEIDHEAWAKFKEESGFYFKEAYKEK